MPRIGLRGDLRASGRRMVSLGGVELMFVDLQRRPFMADAKAHEGQICLWQAREWHRQAVQELQRRRTLRS